jgi:penicillin-binding protein 1C
MPTSIVPLPIRSVLPTLERHALFLLAVLTLILCAISLAWPVPQEAANAPVVSLQVTDRSGGLLREVQPDGRARPVSLDAMAPAVVQAAVAVEDRRFWIHPGVDPVAIARAARSNGKHGRIVSGASTITMQVARLLRTGPSSASRGWKDKIAEAHLALRLEARWSKMQILETWLNRVSFGNRAIGIDAAARTYFGKSARDLNRAEAAFLVGLPQSPGRYNPFRHLDRARKRQARVLDAMVRAGHLQPHERDHLRALPLDLQEPAAVFRAPHFTEWVLSTAAARQDAAPVAELRTTIDSRLQETVEQRVRAQVSALEADGGTNAAAVVLDNRTGEVLAYVGSADFWNAQAGGQNDGVQMLRQPGSTLKPFTYARALADRSHTAASVLADIELQIPAAGGAFSPTNYDDRFHGPTPLRTALASSYNVPAVRLTRQMGPARLLETLHAAGFESLDRPASHYGVGLTLGNGEVRLLELARAYAGLARGGSLPPIQPVRWSRTATGDTLRSHPDSARSMGLPEAAVHIVRDVLSDPAARAPAFGDDSPLTLPFPTAAKTGTSKDYRDNWTVGFTPRHTVAVWVGNFDGSPMRRVSGVSGAGPLFQDILMDLGPGGAFSRPAGITDRPVCPASGKRPAAACPTARSELFLAGTAPADTCTVHRRIAIDRRTGRRATPTTPPDEVQLRRYSVYPERYHAWMRRNDVPLPPPAPTSAATSASLRSASAPGPAATDTTGRRDAAANRLQIQYPTDGSQFIVDPVLRRAHQRIHLRGVAPPSWTDVHWTVNERRLDRPYTDALWTLREGRHTFALQARAADGHHVRSRPVTVRVHRLDRSPAWASRKDGVPR